MRNRATTPLSKARLRQSWSKYNLYNLSRLREVQVSRHTFFQAKWKSKSVLRSYHGEQVREGLWNRMFRRTLRSVIPMQPQYLAANDGSLESAGRGSGLKDTTALRTSRKSIPYMQMTFAPMERRLDTAVFRALFASSARQARQFVVHGAVTVNGKKMHYPGYLLNPGDMFQVNPDRVMYATGQPKITKHSKTEAETEKPAEEQEVEEEEPESSESETEIEKTPRTVLKSLLSQAKSILASPREKIGAKKKQDLRAFSSSVKRLLSKSKSSTILTDSLEAQFLEIKNQLKISRENKKTGKTSLPSEQARQSTLGTTEEASSKVENRDEKHKDAEVVETSEETNVISDYDYNQLYRALTQMQENPIDESKPYATPWAPRDYMSAFAFIPRYLEVNQNICAAVYLRHPVARPGMAEVPTPFGTSESTLAYTWYLRRR